MNQESNQKRPESSKPRHVSRQRLTAFVAEILVANGVREKDADVVSDCLVFANRSGVDSHGVVRLAHYVTRLANGSIKSKPSLQFYPGGSAVGTVDGDDGLGHVVSRYATDRAIELAARCGIGAVAARNSSHFGMAAYYSLQMAEKGFIGICITPTDKLLVPFGATRPFFGSNPICFAFPSDGLPVVLDMATTSIPYGKITLAAVEDRKIPDSWAVDETGKPTTDPKKAVGLHPAAGPKGSGLAMAIDILGSVLTGMPFGPHITSMYNELDKPRKLGHLFIAIDVGRFIPLRVFESALADLTGEMASLEPAEGFDRVMYPGQMEGERRTERDKVGIPLEIGLIAELNATAERFGIAPLLNE